MSDFGKAVNYVLENEGGFSNNASDPGRATNFGITSALLSKWRRTPVNDEDVKTLLIEEAKEIYKVFFWLPMKLDQTINDSIATAILDIAVNCGEYQAVHAAQAAIGTAADGVPGPKTLEILNQVSAEEFLFRFISIVQNGYVDLVVKNPEKLCFLKGWIARTQRLLSLIP